MKRGERERGLNTNHSIENLEILHKLIYGNRTSNTID